MYKILKKEETVRITPEKLGDNLVNIAATLTYENYEGRMDNEQNLVVVITNVKPIGDGEILHGDGAVYQKVKFDALVFKPEIQEVIEGYVCEVLEFGAFIRFGPLDALLHVSQIMDDRITIDVGSQRLVGKDTKRDLKLNDKVRARIVSVSLNERSPRESKIGLTMRQVGLGKLAWLEDERKKESDKGKETGKEKGKEKEKGKKGKGKKKEKEVKK